MKSSSSFAVDFVPLLTISYELSRMLLYFSLYPSLLDQIYELMIYVANVDLYSRQSIVIVQCIISEKVVATCRELVVASLGTEASTTPYQTLLGMDEIEGVLIFYSLTTSSLTTSSLTTTSLTTSTSTCLLLLIYSTLILIITLLCLYYTCYATTSCSSFSYASFQ